MKGPILILLLLTATLSGCLLLPRTASNGRLSVHLPPMFVSSVERDGAMNISRAESPISVSISRVSSPVEFEKQADDSLALERSVHDPKTVIVAEISTLGHLKGRGYKISFTNARAETYMFLVESGGWWMISAFGYSHEGVWKEIISSLRATNA